jgi:hypothetical protein
VASLNCGTKPPRPHEHARCAGEAPAGSTAFKWVQASWDNAAGHFPSRSNPSRLQGGVGHSASVTCQRLTPDPSVFPGVGPGVVE